MPAPYIHRRMVEFADTDMAGIMHFSAFFRFMESAEHALIRSLGLSVFGLADPTDEGPDGGGAVISFPRVSADCDFRAPARCEDELDIAVTVEKIGRTSITYGFRFTRDGDPIATGRMTSVCCRLREGQPPEPTPLPSGVAELLSRHAAE